ncbi:MAG: hypothetical protein A3H91_03595 [Gammaproteobacteria bacterium RIFCSPLOWO2_02_FULL_61_13]|nr:MAG: hypothetical protein A3H91_03595 [Gammaproteobacteria bacterium RIFCSPLOWO2_02_FULL_61_13]
MTADHSFGIFAATLFCCLGGPASAQEEPSVFIDPDAGQLLMSAARQIKNVDAYSVRVDATFDTVLHSGAKVEHTRESDVIVRRPDGIFADQWDDTGVYRQIFYDGKKFTLLDVYKGVYGQIDVPPSIDAALDVAIDEFGLDAPLADFLTSDTEKSFRTGVTLGVYVGTSVINEIPVHHLYFSHQLVDFQVWIDMEGAPLFRKIVITYKNRPGSPQYRAVFSDWDFSPQFDNSDFIFDGASSAQQIEVLKVKK